MGPRVVVRSFTYFLIGILMVVAFTPIGMIGIVIIFIEFLPWTRSSSDYFRSFGTAVEKNESSDAWEAIYTTRFYDDRVPVIISWLRAEEVPVIVENDNLFNSGIQFELGLAAPLLIRVPGDEVDAARLVVEKLTSTGENQKTAET